MANKWETVKELKERTGFCRSTIMKFFDKPGISVRLGRTIRFNSDAVDEILVKMSDSDYEGNK